MTSPASEAFGETSGLYHIFANQVRNEAWAVLSRRYLKKNSTESRSDLNFEDLRPRTHGRMYCSLGMNGLS